MLALTSSQKVLVTAILALVLSCGAYVLAQHLLDAKIAEYLEARDAYAQRVYEKENESRAFEVLEKTVAMRSTMEKYLVSVDEPLEFLALVDDYLPEVAGASGDLVSLSKEEAPTSENGKKGVEEQGKPRVRVVMNAKADWQNLFHLLMLLEHIPYATDIERAVITLSETGGEYDWSADVFLSGGLVR